MANMRAQNLYLNNVLSRGWDDFYEIPRYVRKFIKKTRLRDGHYMKVQSVAHLVTVFDSANKIVRRIPYESIQDRSMLPAMMGDLNA